MNRCFPPFSKCTHRTALSETCSGDGRLYRESGFRRKIALVLFTAFIREMFSLFQVLTFSAWFLREGFSQLYFSLPAHTQHTQHKTIDRECTYLLRRKKKKNLFCLSDALCTLSKHLSIAASTCCKVLLLVVALNQRDGKLRVCKSVKISKQVEI